MSTKLSQILSGGAIAPATDQLVAVRSGATDVLVTPGTASSMAASNAAKTVVASVNGTTTAGHVATFADAAGTVQDGGVLGTAAAQAASSITGTVAAVSGGVTAGHLAVFSNTAGTIVDGGAPGSAISLTTTGTSGAATLTSGTLNVPEYQGALTLTTTGTSGAATLSGNTLNVPNYATGSGMTPIISSGVPSTVPSFGVGQIYIDSNDGNREYIYTSSGWQYVNPKGFTLQGPNWGWDTKACDPMTLSSNNTVATVPASPPSYYNYGGMQASPAKAGGLRYFEITPSHVGVGESDGFGFFTQNQPSYQYAAFGTLPASVTWTYGGTVYAIGKTYTIGTAGSYASGNTLCFAVDIVNRLIWLRVNNGNWNNNPSATPGSSGGFDISLIGPGDLFIGGNNDNGASSSTIINLGTSSFAQAVPTGFEAWVA